MKALLFLPLFVPETLVLASSPSSTTSNYYDPPAATCTATSRYNEYPHRSYWSNFFHQWYPLPWLSDTGKEVPKCLSTYNQQWSECAIPCPETCDEPAPPSCRKKCKPGCECMPGFKLNRIGYCINKATCAWTGGWRAPWEGYYYTDREKEGLEGPNERLPRPEEESESKGEEKDVKEDEGKEEEKDEDKDEEKNKDEEEEPEEEPEEKDEKKDEDEDEEKGDEDENNDTENKNEEETEQEEKSQAEEEHKDEKENKD